MEDEETRQYLAIWNKEGFEYLYDFTAEKQEYEQYKKDSVFRILKGEHNPPYRGVKPSSVVQWHMLRARYNGHRSYEMYAFNSTMTYEELTEVMDEHPQIIVDWIRKNGKKVYSDRSNSDSMRIV